MAHFVLDLASGSELFSLSAVAGAGAREDELEEDREGSGAAPPVPLLPPPPVPARAPLRRPPPAQLLPPAARRPPPVPACALLACARQPLPVEIEERSKGRHMYQSKANKKATLDQKISHHIERILSDKTEVSP
ncbi:Os11g0603900 [Oryza sativa Japonica Group]|uniref:Os11g0603900 protein n=1 Tax=Oryza sativa subsp. japonica TaxID=39947 RepID=H2KWI3_ORYSJ|nr:hypothetical protein LOC_Os11g39079 [Oryza sativa Japonica Group]BAT14780.1 Os11g0603900 [Oryza sativa Japonica Group]